MFIVWIFIIAVVAVIIVYLVSNQNSSQKTGAVSYTHLRAHET